jgi:hypothetical protein
MEKSENIADLAKALYQAQAELPAAPKDSINPHYRSKYTDINTLIETCRPVLAKHGLCIVQTFEPSNKGITIETAILHESGQWISGTMYLPLEKQTPQGMGSAATYGRRYGLAAILGMVSDEDDDAQSAETQCKPATASTNTTEIGDLI